MDWDSLLSRPHYYDRDGKPLTREEWAQLFERACDKYRIVRQTTVGRWWVSTVWLGLDHNYSATGPPLIFETIVGWRDREPGEGLEDLEMARYSTLKQARAGHARFVRDLRRRAKQLDAAMKDALSKRRQK